MQETLRIVKNLAGCLSSDTEKSPAVWIVLVAFEREKFASFDFNGHTALGGQAIHGTHSGDLAFSDHALPSYFLCLSPD
jgi:hypothetical protein